MSERENLRLIRRLHRGESYSKNLLASGLLTDKTLWWAAGPPEVLPWAGAWRGREKIAQWFKTLDGAMEYDRFEPAESIAEGNKVVILYRAHGRARSTGKEFKSDIVRIYTLSRGRLVEARSYYDTASYAAALGAS